VICGDSALFGTFTLLFIITELRPIKPALHQARTLDLLLKRAEQVHCSA